MRSLLATALVVLALTVSVGCTTEEEDLPPTETPGTDRTPVPESPTAAQTPGAVQDEWDEFVDPEDRYSARYPDKWFRIEGSSVVSFDPSTWDDLHLPPASIKVDFVSYEAKGSTACGALAIDPETGEGTPRQGASPATLGGIKGWQLITDVDPPEDGLTRIHAINVIYKGYCFGIHGYFVQDDPDEATFRKIAESFHFTDS